ncbi:hypothetical protein [Loigolactobacillus rennini]|uniref:Transposase n=1 Tax=Loigolactobacillus rennini DSM 20253 TaxID=1423796 RepID=A0A0R2D2Z2_9LACO|nr:hypothetical protein [Loigolactobacillus rennini]KRM94630.1 hypothetical protein FC24_GL000193 [Loigolactobacillus rennini DSM 20253]
MTTQKRYYQPQNSKDAMRQIEKLFNQYKNAPLTDALLQYHQKLVTYLQTSVVQAAKKEGQPQRAQTAQTMAAGMTEWLRIRALGKPFTGEMRHFKIMNAKQHRRVKNRRVKGHRRQPTMRKIMR